MAERRRPFWRRPAPWIFVLAAILAAVRIAWSLRNDENPFPAFLGILVDVAIAVAVLLGVSLTVMGLLRRRTLRDLEVPRPGVVRFDALIGPRHRAARAFRAELLEDPDDRVPERMTSAIVTVDAHDVQIVGVGYASVAVIPVEEITGIVLGIETGAVFDSDALLLRLAVEGVDVELPIAPAHIGRLGRMPRPAVAALAVQIAGILRVPVDIA